MSKWGRGEENMQQTEGHSGNNRPKKGERAKSVR